MNDIITRYVKLPDTVHGFVCADENGDYNIYINQNDPDERKLTAILHEERHIYNGHLESQKCARALEAEV